MRKTMDSSRGFTSRHRGFLRPPPPRSPTTYQHSYPASPPPAPRPRPPPPRSPHPLKYLWQKTHAFVASPEMVVATALAGSVTFNPEVDSIPTADGGSFKFDAPFGKELPVKGFDPGEDTFQVCARCCIVLCFVSVCIRACVCVSTPPLWGRCSW